MYNTVQAQYYQSAAPGNQGSTESTFAPTYAAAANTETPGSTEYFVYPPLGTPKPESQFYDLASQGTDGDGDADGVDDEPEPAQSVEPHDDENVLVYRWRQLPKRQQGTNAIKLYDPLPDGSMKFGKIPILDIMTQNESDLDSAIRFVY